MSFKGSRKSTPFAAQVAAEAAGRINIVSSLNGYINLTRDQYLALRNGAMTTPPGYKPKAEFIVDRIGSMNDENFQDNGIEYYRYVN